MESVCLRDITKFLLAQILCDHWFYLLFTVTIHCIFTARKKQAIVLPATHAFYLFPSRPGRAHPLSKTLTVVALGLGGLAFPLLPVLLPLFVSDFSFCSLTGKNKYNARHVIRARTNTVHTQIAGITNKTRGGEWAALFPSLGRGWPQFWRLRSLISLHYILNLWVTPFLSDFPPFFGISPITQLQFWIHTERPEPVPSSLSERSQVSNF